MSHEELSFCELKSKEIVNELDGRKLGRAVDLIFSPQSGCVLGIIAPHTKRSFFFKGQEVFIPLKNISKIGPDVILVRLTPDLSRPENCINVDKGRRHHDYADGCAPHTHSHAHDAHAHSHAHAAQTCDYNHQNVHAHNHAGADCAHNPCDAQKPHHKTGEECDFKCEKCMLFDCDKRWKYTGEGKTLG